MNANQHIHDMVATKGRVFDIQRMSIYDGPGIRTTVFLKGCPLRCAWCHNPEGLVPETELAFTPALCAGCGACLRQCPNNAHTITDDKHAIDRGRCELCFACAAGCCSAALEQIGRDMTVADVMAEAMRDKPYYDESGGGITISGGEPLLQFAFTKALLESARAHGLHTCIETSGFGATNNITELAPITDLFLFDVKETDPERHRRFTGLRNDTAFEALRRLDAAGGAILLRCILIPEVNLRDDHLQAVAALARSLRNGQGIGITAYHPLGKGKLQRLGIEYEPRCSNEFTTIPHEDLAHLAQRFRALGCEQVSIY